MELVRSVSYPAKMLHPTAFRQVDEDALVETREEKQARITTRRDHALSIESGSGKSTVTQIVIQAPANQSPELKGLPQLAAGQSSSAFLAQQISQLPDEENGVTQSPVHQQAAGAYGNTLGLTTTVMGLEGFRGRTV